MEIKKGVEKGITIIIPRPEEMSLERFLTLAMRLEKIVDQLGGNLHVTGKSK